MKSANAIRGCENSTQFLQHCFIIFLSVLICSIQNGLFLVSTCERAALPLNFKELMYLIEVIRIPFKEFCCHIVLSSVVLTWPSYRFQSTFETDVNGEMRPANISLTALSLVALSRAIDLSEVSPSVYAP